MNDVVSSLADESQWPDEVGFLPFIGAHYPSGFDGLRALLLGESHYIADEAEIEKAGGVRGYTRHIFKDCESSMERTWTPFFRRLDSVVSRELAPSNGTAAEAWSRVAFANFVQKPVGASWTVRPDARGWNSGRLAFPVLLDRLLPDIVLVLGREAFNHTPDESGRCVGRIEVSSSPVPRSLWEMEHKGGKALMSWVYHPARCRDSDQSRIDVFNELLIRARNTKA